MEINKNAINAINDYKRGMAILKTYMLNDFGDIIEVDDNENLKLEYNSFRNEFETSVNEYRIIYTAIDSVVLNSELKKIYEDLSETYNKCIRNIINKQVCEVITLEEAKIIGSNYSFVGTLENAWKYCEDNNLVHINYPIEDLRIKDETKLFGKKVYIDENGINYYCVK